MTTAAAQSSSSSKQQKTGKTKADLPADDKVWQRLLDNADAWGYSKVLLKKDLSDERKAIKKPEDHKDFKPLVLSLDEAMKKIWAGFNYKQGEPWTFQVHPELLLEGIGLLVDALAKKDPAFLKDFFKQFDDRLKGLAAKSKSAGDASDEAAKKRIEAWCTLLVCLLNAFVVVVKIQRAFWGPADIEDGKADPDAEKDIREKVDKGEAAKAVIEWCAEMFSACATLLWNPDDRSALREWSKELRGGATKLCDMRDYNAKRWEEIRHATPEEKKKAGEKRAEDRKKTMEATKDPKQDRIGRIVSFLKALADLVDKVLKAFDAWSAIHPKELAGNWKVEGLPDGHVEWTLELSQKTKNEFEAKLKGKGKRHPEERKYRETNVFEEVKATAEAKRDPAKATLQVTWKPSEKKERKFPAAGDPFFYGSGTLEEEFKILSPPVEIVCESSAIGQKPGETKPVHLTRAAGFGEWLKFVISVLRCVGAAWTLLPEQARLKIEKAFLKTFGPWLSKVEKAILDRCPSVLKDFKVTLESEGSGDAEKFLLGVSLKDPKGRVKLTAKWNFIELVNGIVAELSEDEDKKKNLERSPWLPEKLELIITHPRLFGVEISAEPWVGREKDPNAGGTLDKLGEALEPFAGEGNFLERFLGFCKQHGVTVDVGRPEVSAGNVSKLESGSFDEALPAVKLPFYAYLDDLGDAIQIPCKLTIKIALTARQVAEKIPQLRALLFAFDVGWTIGSMLNETKAVQDAVEFWGGIYMNWAVQEDWNKQYFALDRATSRFASSRGISLTEEVVGLIKSPHYTAESYNRAHGIFDKLGHGAHPKYEQLRRVRDSMAAAANELLAGRIPKGQYPSASHAMAMAYVLGSDSFTKERIRQQITADRDAKKLHPIQADLLRFYLIDDDADVFDSEYDLAKKTFLATYQQTYDQAKKAVDRAGQNGFVSAEQFLTVRWVEMVKDQEHREFVHCMVYEPPDPAYQDRVVFYQGPSGWMWQVERARPNESISIEFTTKDRQSWLPFRTTSLHIGGSPAILVEAQFHHTRGAIADLKDALLRHKTRETRSDNGATVTGAWLELQVTGQDKKEFKDRRFLELDSSGNVMHAISEAAF